MYCEFYVYTLLSTIIIYSMGSIVWKGAVTSRCCGSRVYGVWSATVWYNSRLWRQSGWEWGDNFGCLYYGWVCVHCEFMLYIIEFMEKRKMVFKYLFHQLGANMFWTHMFPGYSKLIVVCLKGPIVVQACFQISDNCTLLFKS